MSRVLDFRMLREGTDAELLNKEFAGIPLCAATEVDLGNTREERQQARAKCRYSNVLPNPGTRVKLTNPASPFINANFVAGIGNKSYIATQGPTPNTLEDFWQMIWDTRAVVIVMTTGLVESARRKCERYWPSALNVVTPYGDFDVTAKQTVDCGEYVISELVLTFQKVERPVTHFWYTGWPDHDAPDSATAVLEMLHRTRAKNPPGAPLVVHCSAGIGRTGTFMAIDMGMDQLDMEWRVTDVLANVTKMRQARGQSIQTPGQYRFVHQALQEYVTFGGVPSMFGVSVPRAVSIHKGAGDFWGFTLRGSAPPFMVEVDENGLAKKAGAVLGDHVLNINGADTSRLSHKEAVTLVQQAGSSLALVLLSKRAVPSVAPVAGATTKGTPP